MTSSRLEPIHFGPGDRLFGLRSEPIGMPARQTAIVICQTWGPEYMRTYRGLYLLADQLARRGFDTLRFDYSSSGDSADVDSATQGPTVEHWIEDIRSAVQEARDLSGAPYVCLLGLRLGALLAIRAAAENLKVDRLALWDLPTSGAAWVEQLSALNQEHYARKNRYRPSWLSLRLPRDELLGAPWPQGLADSIGTLSAQPPLAPEKLLLLQGEEAAPAGWEPVRRVDLPEPMQWTHIERLTTPWSSATATRMICDSLEGWLP